MERNLRKTRVGIVTSDKMDKTVIVSVEQKYMHPLYKKFVKQTKKFACHNEALTVTNDKGVVETIAAAKEGDTVEITETRPISKTKRWRVSAIISRAK